MEHNRTDRFNPFRDFNLLELEDAYEYFTYVGDERGCELVADIFCKKSKLNHKELGL